MNRGYDSPLYILAFDHRTSFERGLFGISDSATVEQQQQMREAKRLILDGLLEAKGVPRSSVGALVDEKHGAATAWRARSAGLMLAMCAETSSDPEFNFEYGEEFARHIDAFEPDFVKVLSRYNVEGDAELNRRQADRLARLSTWLADGRPRLLFELLVPPTPRHLTMFAEDADRYASELRPTLVVAAIKELHDRGVEPDVWKVEGLESPGDCALIVDAAHAGGRTGVGCVVLGAGAPEDRVAHWLRQAASVSGFTGFAIGRTIWWDALDQWRRRTITSGEAVQRIARNYTRAADLYTEAAGFTDSSYNSCERRSG